MNAFLDGARVLLSLAFLTYASWSDFKKREVSNMVWVIFAPLAFALTSLQIYTLNLTSSPEFVQQTLYVYALSFTVTFTLSYILFYAGAFGGADAKALICISIAFPSYPIYLLQPQFGFVSPLFPVTTFSNGVLLASLSVFYAVIRNLVWKHRTGKKLFGGFEMESKWRKTLTFLCGYKVKTEELEKREHLYPLEDIRVVGTGKGERKLVVMPKDENRKEIVERILNAARQGKLQNEVWVTPGLPLLIFITAGFIVALFFGDIVWVFLQSTLMKAG